MSYLINGQIKSEMHNVGPDVIYAGDGHDIIFADTINTDHLQWDERVAPQGSGYAVLEEYLKSTLKAGDSLSYDVIYNYLSTEFRSFIHNNDTHGANDTIFAGSGNDLIAAGAGNDQIHAGAGNDLISSGLGVDTVIYEVLDDTDATAGHDADLWIDFNLGHQNEGTSLADFDVIKFGEKFFDGLFDVNQTDIEKFIQIEADENNHVVLKVDRDGDGEKFTSTALLVLENQQGLTLQQLLDQHQIIIA